MSDQKKALVVEDNDFVRMQICMFLAAEGYETVEAIDGKSALAKINDDIDIAIVDVRMEPMNGFEFVRMIRNDEVQTPVVLVTGDENSDLLSEASKLNITAILKKPIQKERLIKTVSRTLGMERS